MSCCLSAESKPSQKPQGSLCIHKADFSFKKTSSRNPLKYSTQIWVQLLTVRCLLETYMRARECTHAATSWPAELKKMHWLAAAAWETSLCCPVCGGSHVWSVLAHGSYFIHFCGVGFSVLFVLFVCVYLWGFCLKQKCKQGVETCPPYIYVPWCLERQILWWWAGFTVHVYLCLCVCVCLFFHSEELFRSLAIKPLTVSARAKLWW